MTNECDVLRGEVATLAAENRRLMHENLELRKVPAYPEAAVRAVWEHGLDAEVFFGGHPLEVARVFTEALRDA